MKKIMYMLMLTLSIKGAAFAQDQDTAPLNEKDKTFEFPDRYFHTRFLIALGKKNRLRLDLLDQKGLAKLPDVDSLLHVFIQDMEPFKDSLADEMSTKTIDYRIDAPGRKKIRIQQFKAKGPSFVLDKEDLSALKLEQDTVYILTNSYRITLFINQLGRLPSLVNGTIDAKIHTLQQSKNRKDWVHNENNNRVHLRTDKDITARRPWGDRIQPNDQLLISPSMSIQNYKNYFVPSFNLGMLFILNNSTSVADKSRYKYKIGAYWEPHFLFSNNQGKLQTFRNDFITLTFGFGPKDPSVQEKSSLLNEISLSYLVGNKGGFYDKNTFRLGLDKIVLFKNTSIEPLLYFNNFFKNVTPGLRITQSF